MTTVQKAIQYFAFGLAIFLTVSIIGGIFGILGLFGGESVDEEIKAYEISTPIQSLEIKINAADLTIKQGKEFLVESNLKHLTVNEQNGVLTINETKKIGNTYNGAVLTLSIPENTVFEKANIITGAGRFTIDSLSAQWIDFELGAGEVMIDQLTASEDADIEGGAGKITIDGGALRNLDLDMGVGQLNLTSALTGEIELDLGVGESNITVLGNKDNYKLDIEKGFGSITVDGESISDHGRSGNGNHSMDISGGVGAINLNFKETEENGPRA